MIERESKPRFTDTAMERGLLNCGVCIILVFLAWLVLAGLLTLALGHRFSEASSNSFHFLCWFSIFAFFANWIYGQVKKDTSLLDCGPPPMQWMYVLSAFIFTIVALIEASSTPSFLGGDSIRGSVWAVSLALFWTTLAVGRVKLYQNGLWIYASFIRWEKIESYRWADEHTLLIRQRTRFMPNRGAIPIPPKFREEATRILKKYCEAQ